MPGAIEQRAYGGERGAKVELDDGQERADGLHIWQRCCERLQAELEAQDYNKLVLPLQAGQEGDRLVVWAPNRYVRDELRRQHGDRISELIAAVRPGSCSGVDFRVGSRGANQAEEASMPIRASAHQRTDARAGVPQEQPGLNGEFRFDSFVEGTSNVIAKASAIQVAENPGRTTYNPLLLYGGVGLGKTHLMHAIGNAIRARSPRSGVVYLHSQRFANDVVHGIRTHTVQEVTQRYRSMGMLLIDDIQFFADKPRFQEEFFHVFNGVLEQANQIVLTSDRYPGEIDGLEERLQSRFVGGLTVEVGPPELETRIAILQNKGAAEGVEIPYEAALHIAERVRSNVRELEGALQRVMASAKFTKSVISVELVRRSLRDLFAVQGRRVTVDHIQKEVAEYYRIKFSDMLSKRRTRAIARPRQIAMCLAKELTNHSLPEIGEKFGGRDHTTVLYACHKIAELRESDPDIAEDYKNLHRKLTR